MAWCGRPSCPSFSRTVRNGSVSTPLSDAILAIRFAISSGNGVRSSAEQGPPPVALSRGSLALSRTPRAANTLSNRCRQLVIPAPWRCFRNRVDHTAADSYPSAMALLIRSSMAACVVKMVWTLLWVQCPRRSPGAAFCDTRYQQLRKSCSPAAAGRVVWPRRAGAIRSGGMSRHTSIERRRHAAVHREQDPVDIGAGVGGEEEGGARNVLGLAPAADRRPVADH